MSVRDNVHQLIDALPEDRLTDVLDYLADLQDSDESMSADTKTAIEEGLNDIKNVRVVSLGEYRPTRGL
jgi:hypothetical protein